MPDSLQHNPESKIQGSGGGDPNMGVFDGIISATAPHPRRRWRAQRVYLGKAVTVSTFALKGDNALRYKSAPIPVTVGTFDTRRKHKGPKLATATRMAAFSQQQRRQLRRWQPQEAPSL